MYDPFRRDNISTCPETSDTSAASSRGSGSWSKPFLDVVEFLPNVYISAYPAIIPEELTHVLNISCLPDVGNLYLGRIYLRLPILPTTDLELYIDTITDFVDQALPDLKKEQKVLRSRNLPNSSDSKTPSPQWSSILGGSITSAASKGESEASTVFEDASEEQEDTSPPNKLLIHDEHGFNRAPAAAIICLCYVHHINVVDAFFMLKEKKRDIQVSEYFLTQLDEHFERRVDSDEESVGKAIRKRLKENLRGFMKKGKDEEWIYEPGHELLPK